MIRGFQDSAAAPYLGMVSATTAQVGLIIISKGALASGMTNYTFVAYSNALAALLLLPISLLVHKRSSRPPLSLLLVAGFFTLGLLGCLAQLTGYTGISYSSAAFASAMLNLIPGFTFILAMLFRMEKISLRNLSFLAKATGTVVSIIGAFVVTLYRGPQILTLQSSESNYVIAGLFLTADCVVTSAFIIVQASIIRKYPAELFIVFFYCLFAAILSTSVSLVLDHDQSAWSLQPNIRLFSVLYSGVVGSAFQVSMNTWCLHKRGPLLLPCLNHWALSFQLFLALSSWVMLSISEGSVVIVAGFYSVMWGKAKEANMNEEGNSESTSETSPLLPTKHTH